MEGELSVNDLARWADDEWRNGRQAPSLRRPVPQAVRVSLKAVAESGSLSRPIVIGPAIVGHDKHSSFEPVLAQQGTRMIVNRAIPIIEGKHDTRR
jgi:hypothetical protein